MGAACCKRLEPGHSTSPHLPFCEVVRRCARVICPVDPPHQKPNYRTRKYGLSDIVGPVSKKDSWVQTDPLPPPRRRKRKDKFQRRRSRSVEFLPYLLERESSRVSDNSRVSGGSLEDLPGQEDALDFQMYFMNRLPRNSVDDGKESLSGRKRQFLSGLLGEENDNSLEVRAEEDKSKTVPKKVEAVLLQNPDVLEKSQGDFSEPGSRRSSITESLREFESSLLDMLEEDEGSLTRDLNREEDIKMDVPLVKNMTRVSDERDGEYVITPIEEEPEEEEEEGGEAIEKIAELPMHYEKMSKRDNSAQISENEIKITNETAKSNKENGTFATVEVNPFKTNDITSKTDSAFMIEINEIITLQEKNIIDQPKKKTENPHLTTKPPIITVEIVS